MDSDLLSAARKGDLEQVRMWMERGASATACTEDGETALALAASHGHEKCVEALASPRAAKAVDKWFRTPMMLAAMGGWPACVAILASKCEAAGADCRDFDGRSALMLAARHGHLECVEILLALSDEDAKDLRGLTAEAIAKKVGHLDVAELLARWSEAKKEGRPPESHPLGGKRAAP